MRRIIHFIDKRFHPWTLTESKEGEEDMDGLWSKVTNMRQPQTDLTNLKGTYIDDRINTVKREKESRPYRNIKCLTLGRPVGKRRKMKSQLGCK